MPKRAFDAEAQLILDSLVENGDTDSMLAAGVKKSQANSKRLMEIRSELS